MKLIALSSQGKHNGKYFAKISDEDYEEIIKHRWQAVKVGYNVYAITKIDYKKVYMHRFILSISDRKIDTDHKDKNGLNNQRDNLRASTRSQNAVNKRKSKNVTSNYFGVSYSKQRNRWVAQIGHNLRQIPLGRYKNEMDAAKAYDAKALELFGEFANLNFKT